VTGKKRRGDGGLYAGPEGNSKKSETCGTLGKGRDKVRLEAICTQCGEAAGGNPTKSAIPGKENEKKIVGKRQKKRSPPRETSACIDRRKGKKKNAAEET